MERYFKYIGAVAVWQCAFLPNALGGCCNISLCNFFDRACWKENREKAQTKYGGSWREEYFKNPKEVYQENLKDTYKEKLSNTHLYILLSSYRQAETYAEKIVNSMEANAKNLADLGVTSHIIVRCDGEKENGQDVISGDLWTYAEILNAKKIAFKVHKSEGVEPSNFQHEYHKPEGAHWELVANEKNLGCSGTRHASIDMIEEEVKQLKAQAKYVYIGIFDGDDWVHEDFYPVLLLNALYTNAPVSNYNGRMGAHGLEDIGLREKRMLGLGRTNMWTIYTDMEKDDVKETLSEKYAELHPNYNGVCCTTKIFEADYFYRKLNSLLEKERKYRSDAERDWLNLNNLSPLEGFCKGACTCTTNVNLFHYTQR